MDPIHLQFKSKKKIKKAKFDEGAIVPSQKCNPTEEGVLKRYQYFWLKLA